MVRTNKDCDRKKNYSKCSDEFSLLFGKRLKTIREARKLTQEEIAELLNVLPRTIQKYEYGVTTPNIEIISKMCSILDCDITYLTGENADNEFRKSLASAAEYLGIKYTTAERISEYDSKIKHVIDVIVHDNHEQTNNAELKNADLLLGLLDSIHEYAINCVATSIKYKDFYGREYTMEDRKQIDSVLRYQPLRECETILNTVYTEYKNIREHYFLEHINEEIETISSETVRELFRKKHHIPKKKDLPELL